MEAPTKPLPMLLPGWQHPPPEDDNPSAGVDLLVRMSERQVDAYLADQMDLLEPAPRRTPRVVVLVPVHNEIDQIGLTLAAIYGQTRPPDDVRVLTDNAIPGIAEVAAEWPCSITSTWRNSDKKAGNLNAELATLLPELHDEDIVFGFDADGVPDPDFIENAIRWLDGGYGAIGATFHGRPGGLLLGLLQRAEFARFARQQARRSKCEVLSGTGWAVRAGALRRVAATRPDGMVYHVKHITEDFELTLALRHITEMEIISPANCRVMTDVMETMPEWISQRLRWQHGTLFALARYGWTGVTTGMIIRQIMTYALMIATPLVALYMLWSFLLFGWAGIDPLNAPWYAAGLAFVILEQAWQARRAGWPAVVMSLLIIPDLAYSVIRQWVYVRAIIRVVRGRQSAWGAGTRL